MIQIKIPKELKSYKTTIGPFTFKQWIYILIGGGISISSYWYVFRNIFPMNEAILTGAALGSPFFFLALYKIHGIDCDQFILQILEDNILSPKKRYYGSENTTLEYMDFKGLKEDELKELSKKERKKYMKQLEKEKEIVVNKKKRKDIKKYLKKKNRKNEHRSEERR